MSEFRPWFTRLTGCSKPHDWQERLALDSVCRDRLLRVPTGLGKTAGTVIAWTWNRVVRQDESWPRRLVFCLPMRVLVEQTVAEVRRWLASDQLLWNPSDPHAGRVGVHVLMGGVDVEEWHLYPDHDAILIGTQDMLLSRALNRGYGSPRARWPMEMAQLHHDALWVLDEVQLMDVALVTSVQFQSFRDDEQAHALRPARSWWMSATMQDEWLRTSVEYREHLNGLSHLGIEPHERTGPLWDVRKSVDVARIPALNDGDSRLFAERILEAHRATKGGLTLAIVNRVDAAVHTFQALETLADDVDLRLAHSRFRGMERSRWREEFLGSNRCESGLNRIIVATQVVEAGVDLSADALVTELAPWPSLVQRFGRCARYGGSGQAVVVDRFHTDESVDRVELKRNENRATRRSADDEETARPYGYEDLTAAAAAVREIHRVDPAALEAFEAALTPPRRARLYPYEPLFVLARRDFDDLFDTGPDLTGADLDVSRFIRTGEERDVSIWWWDIADGDPPANLQPRREELCAVPVHEARKWIGTGTGEGEAARVRAWVWDYLDDGWRRVWTDRDVYPGQTILVDQASGGYDAKLGFTGKKADRKRPIPLDPALRTPLDAQTQARLRADLAQDHDDLSQAAYKTIATHGAEAAREARTLAAALHLPPALATLLDLAARVHDLGKAHPVFAAAIRNKGPHAGRADLAKAPEGAWHRPSDMYNHHEPSGRRRGFRHELASALALMELLRRVDLMHEGLLGSHRALLCALKDAPVPVGASERIEAPGGLVAELAALGGRSVDLVLFLVCAHHGKVRASWQATPSDQEWVDRDGRGPPLRGVRDGDAVPAIVVADAAGADSALPATTLHLDAAALGLSHRYGASWTERVDGLLKEYGPFALGLLETLLRVADVRASRLTTPDPRLQARSA